MPLRRPASHPVRPRTARRRLGVLAATVALVATGLGAVAAAPAGAATTSPLPTSAALTWGTNGRVHEVLATGGRLVVAGAFSALVGPSGASRAAGNVAVFDPATGTFAAGFAARTNGAVLSVATDGTTLWLGGDFTSVNGQPRTRLAAVSLATGALTPWAPSAANSVNALALVGGDVLVGGSFLSVSTTSGTTGPYLARLTTSGARSAVPAPAPDAQVRTFLVAPGGGSVYVGGDFAVMGGNTTAARKLARLSVATGQLDTTFASGPTNGTTRGPVQAVAGDGTSVYVAVGGGGGACAALDTITGATRWSQRANGDMQGVEVVDGVVYCGGHFGGTASFGGQDRQKIAAVDPATGTVLAWAPRVDSPLGIWSMDADATSLYVGGDFTRFGATTGLGHLAQVVPPSAQSVPAPVTALVGTAYDGRVELTWSAPDTDHGSPVTWYTVTRRSGGTTKVVASRQKTPAFDDTAVVDGTTYAYDVVAVNALGASATTTVSGLVPARGAAAAPAAPRDVLATVSTSQVDVAWRTPSATGGSPVTGYRVYRTPSGGSRVLVGSTGAAATTWTDPGAAAGTSYTYEVSALNAVGEGPRAAALPVTPTSSLPPTPVVTATSQTGPQVLVTWTVGATTGPPITKYVVVRDRIRVTTLPATSQGGGSWVDTDVVKGQTYRYQVKSVSAAGTSKVSKAVLVTVR
ncbi:fibronectin type III domain-containing protein [Lapillicoccus jejuensis]|uniref:Fibronectin type 3 domain-containing protein n=1 Tax=Lapillicoccus jejuensis TaxID=402171 RepID=A0A542E1P8_9MICO|nr:fibronectin type III domain-containing protein [Lapillicoccus jejuensis]TQJ09199.1 fibronectin type 3 domain-containing protein [Lapillicoccus jejuensis]